MADAVLLDLDGTLTDPKDGITRCIRFALKKLGMHAPPQDRLTWCIGPSLRKSFAQLLHTNDEALVERALSIFRQRFAATGMFENELYPEVIPSLERISAAGLGIYLCTAKPRVFAERILDHFGLSPFFQGIYGSELDGRWSDKGDLIAHILSREALDPRGTLMVGDRADDVIGGRRNGTLTASVSYGYGSPEEIAASDPDYLFDSIYDLAVFLIEEANR